MEYAILSSNFGYNSKGEWNIMRNCLIQQVREQNNAVIRMIGLDRKATKMGLEVLDRPPAFDVTGILTIEALSPLSMVSKMPGKFYRSQPAPTDEMLYGLLENALGWHISEVERGKLLNVLKKRHGEPFSGSGNGFKSLLQYHLTFAPYVIPPVQHFVDLWSQHVHGPSFVGGSREYSKEAIPIMNAIAGKQITVNDRAEAKKEPELITTFTEGQIVHLNVLRPYFPQFYVSPTPREYVQPLLPYMYRVQTSDSLAKAIAGVIEDPAAPLYLGSNDGWVEARWKVL